MNDSVVFDEEMAGDTLPVVRPERRDLGRTLMRVGMVSSPGDAAALLAVAASLLIATSIYLLASSVPPVVELGPDELRTGEQVPSYRGGR